MGWSFLYRLIICFLQACIFCFDKFRCPFPLQFSDCLFKFLSWWLSSIPKTSPSTWTIASGVISSWLFSLLFYVFRVKIFWITFKVTLTLIFNFAKHLKYFIAAHFMTYMYILLSVISFHCNIFVKLSVFYMNTLQTVRKISVSCLCSLIPTMEGMCYSKATKREITLTEYWKKNMYWSHVLHWNNNQNHSSYWVLKESRYNSHENSTTSCQNLTKFFELSRE